MRELKNAADESQKRAHELEIQNAKLSISEQKFKAETEALNQRIKEMALKMKEQADDDKRVVEELK